MIELKNFIKEKLKEYDPEFDTRDGSVLSDFLINPLSLIFQSFYFDLKSILNKTNLTNIEEISEQELDYIANLYGIQRKIGSKATGEAYFYFNNPSKVNIPIGFRLYYNNLLFYVLEEFSMSYSEVVRNYTNNLTYKVGPIKLIASDYGNIYNIPKGVYLKPENNFSNLAYVITSSDFINGGEKETNTQLFERIKNSLYGNSLSSPVSIENLIKGEFPFVQEVNVIGAGHPLMIRDKVYNYIDNSNLVKEDFNLVYSGITDPIYDKKHKAYAGCFYDEDPSLEVKFPPINKWTDEFSDDDYKGIYKENDLNYAETATKIIVQETFNNGLSNWKLNDSFTSDNKIFYSDEIRIENNILILGKSDSNINDNIITADSIYKIKEKLEYNNIKEANDLINTYLNKINNFSPIIHRELPYHYNIEISTSMFTNDKSENGQLAYITVLRNKDIYLSYDGFGIAWRKQPDYLIRMKNNNYGGNIELKRKDLERFEKEHNLQGNTLKAEDYLGNKMLEHPEVWYYNVFLVDNDVLQEGLWVGLERYLDQSGGKNNFIQASKVWIEPNKFYNFIIKIYKGFGVEAWVHDETETFNSTTHRVINKGVTYPNYIPLSGTTIDSQDYNNLIRTNFGIGVLETKGSEWKVKNIFIRNFSETFSAHLFKFDVSKFNSNDKLNIKYYGFGYDPNLLDNNTGVKLGIFNFQNNSWQLIGSHKNSILNPGSVNLNNILIKKEFNNIVNYKDNNNFIYLAAIANNNGFNHFLRSYYISIDNGDVNYIHRKNCTDIYVKDFSNLITSRTKVNIVGNKATLNVPFLYLIVDVLEPISKIPYDKNSYIIKSEYPEYSFSNQSSVSIIFENNYDGASVEVIYKYWGIGPDVYFLLMSPNYRYPCADYMIKAVPPAIVVIENLEYKGNISSNQLKQRIKDYINNYNFNLLHKSTLVEFIYSEDVDFVDLNIDIKIYEYNLDMTFDIIEMDQTYYLPQNKLCRFFTDYEFLMGVTQLNV